MYYTYDEHSTTVHLILKTRQKSSTKRKTTNFSIFKTLSQNQFAMEMIIRYHWQVSHKYLLNKKKTCTKQATVWVLTRNHHPYIEPLLCRHVTGYTSVVACVRRIRIVNDEFVLLWTDSSSFRYSYSRRILPTEMNTKLIIWKCIICGKYQWKQQSSTHVAL